eukprot:3181656-Prymnesium_polylepis.1
MTASGPTPRFGLQSPCPPVLRNPSTVGRQQKSMRTPEPPNDICVDLATTEFSAPPPHPSWPRGMPASQTAVRAPERLRDGLAKSVDH